MTLTFYQILILFGAISLIVLASVIVAGVLVYKTKYAGGDMFHGEPKNTAESFNIDQDFLDDEVEDADKTAPENQEVIKKANESFISQFTLKRLSRAGDAQTAIAKEA